MIKLKYQLVSLLLFLSSGAVGAQTIRVVDRPDNTSQSNNYVNSRAPLRQQSFIKLPVGSIHPAGRVARTLCLLPYHKFRAAQNAIPAPGSFLLIFSGNNMQAAFFDIFHYTF